MGDDNKDTTLVGRVYKSCCDAATAQDSLWEKIGGKTVPLEEYEPLAASTEHAYRMGVLKSLIDLARGISDLQRSVDKSIALSSAAVEIAVLASEGQAGDTARQVLDELGRAVLGEK